MSDKPKGFKDLDAKELYRSAIEDFALPVDESDKGKKTVLIAAFAEGGVEWNDYVSQHPEVEPVVEESVVTSADVAKPKKTKKEDIVVAQTPNYEPHEKLLIKMERENPLYEVRGHKFTTENPYALMNPKDAEYVLEHEDGFRQARPSELQEFYG